MSVSHPAAKHHVAAAAGAKANPMKLVKIFFKKPDYYIHGTGDVESLGDQTRLSRQSDSEPH